MNSHRGLTCIKQKQKSRFGIWRSLRGHILQGKFDGILKVSENLLRNRVDDEFVFLNTGIPLNETKNIKRMLKKPTLSAKYQYQDFLSIIITKHFLHDVLQLLFSTPTNLCYSRMKIN